MYVSVSSPVGTHSMYMPWSTCGREATTTSGHLFPFPICDLGIQLRKESLPGSAFIPWPTASA